MSDVGAGQVRQLREQTGAGIMDCKRALAASGGDLAKAVDHLRKEGVLKAAKKAGRTTLEGLIGESAAADGSVAALVELNCETDFVARTDDFQNFLNCTAEHLIVQKPHDLNDLLGQKFSNGRAISESLASLIAKLGENMGIRRFARSTAEKGEALGRYLHAGSKIGVIVKMRGGSSGAAREVAMHVAAMHPRYLRREQVPAAVLEEEKEILRASPEVAGKPANLLDRIIEGKLARFFSEVCLLDQPFIRDPSGKKSVGAFLKETLPGVEILEFVRFQVGEGLE